MNRIPHVVRSVLSGVLIVVLTGGGSLPAEAQERPDRRQTRTNISPDLLVSFDGNTPLNQFIEIINPIVVRERDKRIVDPKNRTTPIGVPI
ncbi:MAG: general secretion pathway protein GspD, partial [Bacteroidetes bacterium QH_2_64_74]